MKIHIKKKKKRFYINGVHIVGYIANRKRSVSDKAETV